MTNLCKIKNCKAGSKYSSATGTNTTGSCTACDTGTYMSSSAHTNTTCTSAGSGYYVDNAGATTRKACSALTAPAVANGTFSSVSPYNAATTCRYVAPAKTATGCSTVTANTVSWSGSAWGSS